MSTEFLSYAVSRFLLEGAVMAVEISVISMMLGLTLGLGLALMRLSRHAALHSPAWCYIWFVRGTPLLLQLVFIYDVLPAIGIKLDTFTTAVIGFSLNEAAFSAEIIRGGVLSVATRGSPRPRSACPARSPCGGSSCRRRCARSCRASPTRRSA
jgi:polar amino acid transport system permease protein